jgi:uncharacterized protein (TIGR03067 family)
MNMKTIFLSFMTIGAMLGAAGCANKTLVLRHVPLSDSSRLQGSWTGREPAATPEGPSHFIIAGNTFEFRGTDPAEWYKGTFTIMEDTNPKQITILVKEGPAPEYIGKNSNGIYRFDGGKLIISANEPGNPDRPSAFETPGSRTIEFTK